MKSVLVNSQRVIASRRWDYDYNQEAYLAFEARLRTTKTSSLEEICRHPITKGETPLWKGDKYVGESEGVLFIRSENLRHYGLDLSAKTFIPSIVHQRMKRSQIQARDVLLAIVGATIGQVAVMPDNEGKANCNQAVAIIRLREDINPHYVQSVLHSSFGQTQIHRFSGGSARPNLPPRDVQDRIAEVMQAAYAARREKLAEAEHLLAKLSDELLGILAVDSVRVHSEKRFAIAISELSLKWRVENNNLRGIKEALQSSHYSLVKVGDLVEFVTTRYEPTQQFRYIEIGDIDVATGAIVTEQLAEYYPETAPNNAQRQVKKGDILISTRRPTRGAIAVVPAELDGEVATLFFSIARLKDISLALPEYVCAFLRTPISQAQIRAAITETTYPVISDSDVARLLLALPPLEIQSKVVQEITRRHSEGRRLRAEADQVVAQAKARVERMILGEEGA
jgi:type I restriction enzyme S subunit